MILAGTNAIHAIAYLEASEIQDFNGVWARDITAVWNLGGGGRRQGMPV